MKKLIAGILILGLLFSLCACIKPEAESGNSNSDGDISSPSDYGGDPKAGNGNNSNHQEDDSLSLLTKQQDYFEGCATDKGYYYLSDEVTELSDGHYAAHLMYMDFASGKEIYLCNNAACTHNTTDCTSVFPTDDFPLNSTMIFVWNNNLYIVSKESDNDGTVSIGLTIGDGNKAESSPAAIYRANLDGTDRTKVYTFDSTVTVEDFVVGDAGGLYFITKKLTAQNNNGSSYTTSSERKLVYLDLSQNTETTVCSMDFGDKISWDVIGCSGRSLVLYGIDFGRDVSAEEMNDEDTHIFDDSYDVFATLDIDRHSLSEIYRVHDPKERNYALDKNNLYFSITGDGSITRVDLKSGEQTELCRIPQDALWGIIGDKLYTRDEGNNTYYFIDVNTGEISHSGLVNKSLGWSLDIIAEVGDRVLTIYDYDATPRGDGAYDINGYKYALINKDDLFNGRDKFTPISMIGTGM